jgi:hypothetical protein
MLLNGPLAGGWLSVRIQRLAFVPFSTLMTIIQRVCRISMGCPPEQVVLQGYSARYAMAYEERPTLHALMKDLGDPSSATGLA